MNRRSMIGKMLGGVAAVVGRGLLVRDAEPVRENPYIPRDYRDRVDQQWNGWLLYKRNERGEYEPVYRPPPVNVRAFRHTNDILVTWERSASKAGRSIEGLADSLERYHVEIIKGS